MKERIIQYRFDLQSLAISPQDVTPAGFSGIEFPTSREPAQLSRFVREVRDGVSITSPQIAAQYLQERIFTPFDAFDQEEVWILLVNTKHRITHEVMLYRGTINAASVRVVEFFKEAVRVNRPAIILSHCHPSGDPTPSPEDITLTRQALEVSRLLGIEVLDHIVVGWERYYSMKEQGLGFE